MILEVLFFTGALVLGLNILQVGELSYVTASFVHIGLAVALPLSALRRWWPFPGLECSWTALGQGVLQFLLISAIVFPIYLLLAHVWNTQIFGLQLNETLRCMITWPMLIGQIIFVALPEELFFRGYVQTRLAQAMRVRRRFLGIDWGWHIPATAVIFAAAHSLIAIQWWHFAIFFPGLLFGYLRERTNGLVAPILVHALSNLVMHLLVTNYSLA